MNDHAESGWSAVTMTIKMDLKTVGVRQPGGFREEDEEELSEAPSSRYHGHHQRERAREIIDKSSSDGKDREKKERGEINRKREGQRKRERERERARERETV